MPEFYSEHKMREQFNAPQFTRMRHRFRGPRESEKINLEIGQLYYSLNKISRLQKDFSSRFVDRATILMEGGETTLDSASELYPGSDIYPGEEAYPGEDSLLLGSVGEDSDSLYPSSDIYPGEETYTTSSTDQIYPSDNLYPGGNVYPGEETYTVDDTSALLGLVGLVAEVEQLKRRVDTLSA